MNSNSLVRIGRRLHVPPLRSAIYPVLCLLCLLLLPYQPDNDPPVTSAAQIAQGVMRAAGLSAAER